MRVKWIIRTFCEPFLQHTINVLGTPPGSFGIAARVTGQGVPAWTSDPETYAPSRRLSVSVDSNWL